MTPIRVLVADDHVYAVPGLCDVIAEATDMRVVGQTMTILKVLELAKDTQPSVIVLDLAWPGDKMAGIKLIPEIKASCPDTQIVAITVYPELIEPARAAGAFALSKGFSKAELLDTIRWAVRFKGPTTDPAEGALKEFEALTEREREVLKLLAQGRTDKEIAQQLIIAEGTAKKHVSSILGKLHASNRAEAAVIAERYRLL